ncbi:M16 family metallopeptidase [Leptospira ilyithenensis]|uniref:Insulinase family protein n=1 Tax=Leptospira ilyithenensis TaxID=2484901 RepID=A0A4V3JXA1_9LEPT|nr:pitrilysin family protein [Leptospira ilyithenensis]TGN11927.1 insulinase family protein [Leptospira ilyithenensis]
MKNKIIIVILFLAPTLFAREMGDFVKDIKIAPFYFSIPAFVSEKLSDGTEILALPNSEFPIIYSELHIYHGKKDLGKRPVEIIRLLEDSWEFSGSKSYPKDTLLQEFENLGANFSLSIGYHKTVIGFSYLKKDEARVFELFQSFWKESVLDDEVISTMRGRISEEIKRRNDNPSAVGGRKSQELLFSNTIQGTSSTIQGLGGIKKEDLVEFQKEILSEKKRVLILSGDVNVSSWKKNLSSLEVYSSAPKAGSEEITTESLKQSLTNTKNKNILVDKDVSQSFVIMMGVLPKHNDPDFYSIQVLNYIIGGGGFNSYFMREIRNNRGLAYSAGSSADFQDEYGVINFFAMTKTESVPEVVSLMKELIDSKFIDTIKEEELLRAKVAITNQFVFLFDDSKKVLNNDLRFKEHHMPKEYLVNFRENIEKVSLLDIRRVGKLYFNPEKLATVVVGPKSLKQGLGEKFQVISPEDRIP